jgi:hypothetical protein
MHSCHERRCSVRERRDALNQKSAIFVPMLKGWRNLSSSLPRSPSQSGHAHFLFRSLINECATPQVKSVELVGSKGLLKERNFVLRGTPAAEDSESRKTSGVWHENISDRLSCSFP